jgi:hypothetical protein
MDSLWCPYWEFEMPPRATWSGRSSESRSRYTQTMVPEFSLISFASRNEVWILHFMYPSKGKLSRDYNLTHCLEDTSPEYIMLDWVSICVGNGNSPTSFAPLRINWESKHWIWKNLTFFGSRTSQRQKCRTLMRLHGKGEFRCMVLRIFYETFFESLSPENRANMLRCFLDNERCVAVGNGVPL